MGLFSRKKSGGTVAEVMAALSAHRAAGRTADAISAATDLDELLKKQFGERHAAVATNLATLTELLIGAGEFTKAAAVGERARDAWRAMVGEKHPSYAKTLALIA
ncbi:MAG: hypothetical protein EPO35_11590, partial [Acidobacteria bacterium]